MGYGTLSTLRMVLKSGPYRKPSRWVLIIAWIALIALTIFVPALIATEISGTIHPGPAGTAIVTHCEDRGRGRYCYGNFRSNDGTIAWNDTRIWGEDDAHVGQHLTANADRGNHEVNVGGSAQNIYFDIIVPIIGLGWWIFLFRLCIWKPLRRRRRTR